VLLTFRSFLTAVAANVAATAVTAAAAANVAVTVVIAAALLLVLPVWQLHS
jgi:hypothetical protein